MSQSELDSFVCKFKFLWHSAYDATLKVETNARKASFTLQAGLGFPQFPFPLPPQHIPYHVPRCSGPAQQRRRERREAARKAASDAQHNNDDATHVAKNICNNVEAAVEELVKLQLEKLP